MGAVQKVFSMVDEFEIMTSIPNFVKCFGSVHNKRI